MSELERLRQERMGQLVEQQRQAQAQGAVQQGLKEEETARQIQIIINQILTPEARERLSNIRLARPAFARQIEVFLIQLYQAGRLPKRLDDMQFKGILEKLHEKKGEVKIRRG